MRLSIWLLASLLAPLAAAADLQVPAEYATIATALVAAQAGDTIHLAPGTYSPSSNGESFPLQLDTGGLTLLGAGPGVSILDAEGSATVLVCSGAARVAQLTITGGHGDWGGAIDVSAGTPELDHLWIVENGALRRGSGINVWNDAAPYIHHNVIWANFDTDLQHSGDPHGVQLGGTSQARVEHNLIGLGDSNGLFVLETAAPLIRNNIFLRNGIAQTRGRGICHFGSPSTVIAYNIFHANSLAALVMGGGVGNISALGANEVSSTDGIYGNLDGDPLLSDPDGLDFALSSGSPAIDAGDPSSTPDPDGSRADIGPFPYTGVTSTPSLPDRLVLSRFGPNPSRGALQFDLEAVLAGSIELQVHDVRGRLVARSRRQVTGGGVSLIWDGRGDGGVALAQGLYLVRIRDGRSEVSTPIFLQR
jgi:hypothetical protein